MENKLLKKLNFKDHKRACVLNAPEEFASTLRDLASLTATDTKISPGLLYDFAMAFAYSRADINSLFLQLKDHLGEDAVLWIAYPKKSSKKYASDISRDQGWQPVGDAGYEAVRQVAIDDDWSALRFRDARYIKTMKRDKVRAMSKKGKERTKG